MKSFLSMMKSSAADTVLKHWFIVMKKRAPILGVNGNKEKRRVTGVSFETIDLFQFHLWEWGGMP